MGITTTATLGRDNLTKIPIYDLGDLQDLTLWSRVVLTFSPSGGGGDTTLDSDVSSSVIALTATGIEVQLGGDPPDLSADTYTVEIDLYDATHTNGFRVQDTWTLTMVAA